jgi:hypothetical protein
VKSSCTAGVVVEGAGTGAVAHVGLHALGSFADRLEVGHSLSEAVPWTGERAPVHDRGKVITQAMLMLAGGGEACTDIEHLRAQGLLFGSVPSDSTLHRVFHQLDSLTRSALWEAIASVRAEVWSRSTATTGNDDIVLDIDASLHEIHSENKAGTAAHYKGGFGFHPMYCFAPTRRAHPRWLAHHQRDPRRLPPHRTPHLTEPALIADALAAGHAPAASTRPEPSPNPEIRSP